MARLKGTIYLEIPQPAWEGEPPDEEELEQVLRDLVLEALQEYLGEPRRALVGRALRGPEWVAG